MVVGIFCNCGGLHKTVEEWRECPMASTPRQDNTPPEIIQQEWHGMTADGEQDYFASRALSIALNVAMIFLIFPLMYVMIGMARIGDYISRRRLRKTTNAAIQEPAKRRPRRAF